MKRLFISLICVGLSAAACSAPAVPATPVTSTAAPTVPPTELPPTQLPTSPPATVLPPTAPVLSPEQVAAYTRELSATVTALLPPPPTPDASGYVGPSFDGVNVWPLTTTNGAELWIAYTIGLRDYLGDVSHFIALYSHPTAGWQHLLKFDVTDAGYIAPEGVRQVPLEPTHIWIAVDSGVGAHGGCFDLYAIDPADWSQTDAAANCGDSPGAGDVRDVNGDGQLDVILNHTNSYVFCYACGVRYFSFTVMRWDGAKLVEQPLTPLPASAPADLRQAVNRAVDLAQGGLWKDAQTLIDQSGAAQAADPIAQWDAALIGLQTQALRAQIADQPYPLLDQLFYGDYAAALDVMRPYSPDQIFSLTGPLIKGTQAENWESTLADWITQTTNSAIQVQPDLAAAYFLRGYGEWLADQQNPAALADVEKAATLDPYEKLFADSVKILK
jgi:hypothetical protein